MKKVVLDTETTGLSIRGGHRIIEIGCVKLRHDIPTGEVFHCYINPEREVDEAAFHVHGLSTDFLKRFPCFPEIANDFLNFIDGETLVIHNSKFDVSFINMELDRSGLPLMENLIIDTLTMARAKFPGAPASLDALCKAFSIEGHATRTKHGALLDAQLLSKVYVYLIGGPQGTLHMGGQEARKNASIEPQHARAVKRKAHLCAVSLEERAHHENLLKSMGAASWIASDP